MLPARRTSRALVGGRLSWIGVALVVAIAAAYWPVARSEFLCCDDPDYVSDNLHVNAGLSRAGMVWAFTSGHAANWHPATWLSHMLDAQWFGMDPGWHHLVNVFFHCANTLLLFLLLRRMTGVVWRSAFVAALFALHPLHVESVAWIAERKDVLSTCFFLLTLRAYVRYAEVRSAKGEVSGERAEVRGPWAAPSSILHPPSSFFYSAALVLFALGLMSKPMLVTLPFLLLLLDVWPLQRLHLSPRTSRLAPLLGEKLPFFALSAASCVVTFLAQQHEGAVARLGAVPVTLRLENALVSYVLYLRNMLWPARLAVPYPYSLAIPPETVAFATLLLIAISVLAIIGFRRQPWLAVGWLWLLGTLVPVIGLVQVGDQPMADRYTYVPLIGIFIAVAWCAGELTRAWRYRRFVLGALSLAVLAACLALTARQVRWWKDSETLFRHTLAVTSDNPIAQVNLGCALAPQGKLDEAAEHFAEAVRVRPNYVEAQSNLGFTLAAKGRLDEAIALYRAVLAAKPGQVKTHYLLASALAAQGNREEALSQYEAELQLNPDHPLALNDLAWILATAPDARLRNGPQAVNLAEGACALTEFREPQFLGTLAAAYAEAGRFADAVGAAEKARDLAAAAGNQELADKNRQLLELYRAGKPYHEPPAAAP